jgi:tight adherence protein B
MLLTFVAGALVIAAGYSILSDLFLRDRSRIGQRVDEVLRKRQRDKARQSSLFKDLGGSLPPEIGASLETRQSLHQRFLAMVEQSGLELSPRRLLIYIVVCGLCGAAITFLLRLSLPAVVGVGAVLAVAPFLYVWFRRRARLRKLMSQLPDAFDLMSRVIRAGQTMAQALQGVADEFDAPVASEFAYCYEQQNLGLSPELALRDLARRTGLLEIKIFVLAVLIQQQSGGNLAELLDKLSTMIRERFRIAGKIRALTAEGRAQAAVLLALPPAMFLIILTMNRDYGGVLLDHPWLLFGVFISELIGALWIRKIVNFDF